MANGNGKTLQAQLTVCEDGVTEWGQAIDRSHDALYEVLGETWVFANAYDADDKAADKINDKKGFNPGEHRSPNDFYPAVFVVFGHVKPAGKKTAAKFVLKRAHMKYAGVMRWLKDQKIDPKDAATAAHAIKKFGGVAKVVKKDVDDNGTAPDYTARDKAIRDVVKNYNASNRNIGKVKCPDDDKASKFVMLVGRVDGDDVVIMSTVKLSSDDDVNDAAIKKHVEKLPLETVSVKKSNVLTMAEYKKARAA